jgi:hypothetical protein
MKAPDKIYVAESLIKTPYGNEWSPTPYISRENTEYIRKDALIEWFNDNIKPLNVLFGEIFVARVKDKLNSM